MIELSYSRLSLLSKSPMGFKKRYIDGIKEESNGDAFRFGSAVDCLLTTPEDFDKRFLVVDIPKPTGQLGDYIESLARCNLEGIKTPDECSQLAYNQAGFKRDTIDKVKERFEGTGQQYYQFLLQRKDKTILSTEEYIRAHKVADSLKNGKYTKFLFVETEGIERKYQFAFDTSMSILEDRKAKGILDILEIDHNRKIITIYDIKTTGKHVLAFNDSFYEFRYDIQAAIYYGAICELYNDLLFSGDYSLEVKFVVESSEYPYIPVIWNCKPQLIARTFNSLNFTHNNKIYKGILQLLEELKFYEENGWTELYDIAINKGNLELS